MATDSNLHDLHAMSGAYALDALDDLERVLYEHHLETCAACRDEVSGFLDTAALLGAVSSAVPSPDLRSRVLTQIGQVRPLAPDAASDSDDLRADESDADELRAMRSARSHRAGRRRFAPMALVAAAVALVVGIGVGVAVDPPWQSGSSSSPQAADQVLIAKVLDADDATSHKATLGQGSAMVVSSATIGKAVVVVSGVKAPSDKVYELWLIRDGTATPAGLLPAKSDQTVLLKGDAATADAAAISVEPAGGSAAPSGQPVTFPLSRA